MEKFDNNARTLNGGENYTRQNIIDIAKNQKITLWLFLGGMVVSFATPFTSKIFWYLVGIVMLYFIYKLVIALKLKHFWLYIIGMCIPIISLFVLVYLLIRSTNVLKAHSIKVGIMGYKKKSLDEYLGQAS